MNYEDESLNGLFTFATALVSGAVKVYQHATASAYATSQAKISVDDTLQEGILSQMYKDKELAYGKSTADIESTFTQKELQDKKNLVNTLGSVAIVGTLGFIMYKAL